MKLTLTLGYSGARMTLDMDLVREVERLGYDSIWSAESYGSDAVTPVAWIAALTSRIHVGTGIMQLAGRTPAATAMTAMTLDGLSDGGFRLGLGVSGPQVVEGWHGQAFGRPSGLRHHADGRAGRKAEAEAAVPDALVDEVALCGPRERIRELVGEWRASGVTTLMVAGDRTAARTMADISS